MSVALLAMAFRQPKVLSAAIPIYKAAGFDVFVHLDLKADILGYSQSMGGNASQCEFISRRYNIFWGGFSMVEAELALIFAALENDKYDRFCLVSDDTLPLFEPAVLKEFLAADLDRIMLRLLTKDDPFIRRYYEFYYLDHQATSLLGRPIETSFIDEEFLRNFSALQELRLTGKSEIDIYYGSQWWCLTRQTVELIMNVLEQDPILLKSFRYSAVPDEIMFQSLIGNFVRREKVRNGPVFVDWSRNPKPYVFTSANELISARSQFPFARKFSDEKFLPLTQPSPSPY